MADTEPLDSGSGSRPSVALQVMEALKSGGGVASLRSLLQETSVSPEHRDVIELLEVLEGIDDTPLADPDLDELTNQQNSDAAELQALRDEVADLREVNDAAAAALGACKVCWGGDESCPVCAGHGRPGANLPDLRLYNELVRPAVERMSAVRGTNHAASEAAAFKFGRFPDEEAQQ